MSKFIWIKITNTFNSIYKSRHYFDLAFVNEPSFSRLLLAAVLSFACKFGR
jgi:hypothetical protein